jgi:hypothetical protein
MILPQTEMLKMAGRITRQYIEAAAMQRQAKMIAEVQQRLADFNATLFQQFRDSLKDQP